MKREWLIGVVCLVLLLLVPRLGAAQMTMPADVYATAQAVVERYPHTGTDDERREAMKKLVQTLRARHGLRWVWKTEHQSLIAPSKDGLGYIADGVIKHGELQTMYIWDTISGGTRKLNAAPLVSEGARPAYTLAVEPKDWLADSVPPPPTVESLQARIRELELLITALPGLQASVSNLTAERDSLRAERDALKAELDALKARPAPTCRASFSLGIFRIPVPCSVVQQ